MRLLKKIRLEKDLECWWPNIRFEKMEEYIEKLISQIRCKKARPYIADEIRNHIEKEYAYDLNRGVDEIRPDYSFDVSCAGSVPEAIICFLDAKNFEDAIRNAVSLGGDADTQAAIAGSIASAYWDVPQRIYDETVSYLDDFLLDAFNRFEAMMIRKIKNL